MIIAGSLLLNLVALAFVFAPGEMESGPFLYAGGIGVILIVAGLIEKSFIG